MKAEEHPLSQEPAFDFKKHASYMKAKALLDGENRLEQLSKFILNTEESLLKAEQERDSLHASWKSTDALNQKTISELEETISDLKGYKTALHERDKELICRRCFRRQVEHYRTTSGHTLCSLDALDHRQFDPIVADHYIQAIRKISALEIEITNLKQELKDERNPGVDLNYDLHEGRGEGNDIL